MKKHYKNLILLLTSFMLCGCKNTCETPECPVNPDPIIPEPEEEVPTLRNYFNPVSCDEFLDTYLCYMDAFLGIDPERVEVRDFIVKGKETGIQDLSFLDENENIYLGHLSYDSHDEFIFDADLPGCTLRKERVEFVSGNKYTYYMESNCYKEESDGLFYSTYNEDGEKTYIPRSVSDEEIEELKHLCLDECLDQVNNGSIYTYYRFRNTTEKEGGKFYVDGNTLTAMFNIDADYGKYDVIEQIVMDYDKMTFLYDYADDLSDSTHIRRNTKKGYVVFSYEDIEHQKPNLEEYTLIG